MYPTLLEIEEALRTLMASLDPALLHGSDAVTALERFSTIEKMAGTGRMLLGKRVAETNAWRSSGAASAEHFLAKVAGCSLAEAHRLLGTAEKLGRLPDTAKAARSGNLSTGQAGDIADAASADPSAEQDLLDLAAQASAAELREEARKRRHAATEDDVQRHRRIRNARSMRTWTGDDGSSHLHWNHLPEAGAEVGAILDGYIEDQFREARRAGRRERRDAYAADAFVDALRDAAAYRRGESIHDDVDLDVDDNLRDDDRERDRDGGDVDDRVRDGDRDGGDADGRVRDAGGGVRIGDRARDRDREGDVIDDDDDERGIVQDAEPVGAEDGEHRAAGARAPGDADRRRPGEPGSADDGTGPGGTRSDRSPGRPSGPRRSRRRGGTRRRGADAKVIVVIDHAALVRGHTEAGETCEIAGIGAVPVASVEALLEDAFIAAVVKKGVDVHTVAHLGRQPSAFQDTAMQAQGVECSTLGCPNRARLERDHRTPYRVTRHTKLSELDFSCKPCHDRKTYEGAMLAPGTGKRPLLSREEQVQWNLDHPGNPVDAPQTSYPNRPTATSTPPRASRPRPPSTASRRRPTIDELTLDL